MCTACTCTHCKDGDCDGHHNAHDWLRALRDGLPEDIAVSAIMNAEKWDEARTRAYIAEKRDWVKSLQDWRKDDKGGTA